VSQRLQVVCVDEPGLVLCGGGVDGGEELLLEGGRERVGQGSELLMGSR
jgi:hypothetical protein